MTRKPDEIRNVDASVRQRLFNLSKEQGCDFQSVLKLYFLERFLYRLSVSRYRDSFLLKGALLFFARAEPEARPFTRPTKDIDLEALATQPDLGGLREISPLSPASPRLKTACASTPRASRSSRSARMTETLWAAARKRYERDSAPERFEQARTRVTAFVGPPYLDAAAGLPSLAAGTRHAASGRDERPLPPRVRFASVGTPRTSTELALASDLAFREGAVGAVALAPALVATQPAVRDSAVAMPHHVLRRQLMTTSARSCGSTVMAGAAVGADAKVIEVHASGGATSALDSRR